MYKSEQLAQHLRQLIENGTLKAHEKLPSLREQVQLSGFSLITVMNAYQELESRGLIYAREKSGYYVAQGLVEIEAEQTQIVSLNTPVEINSLVFKYLKSIQDEKIVPLGSAFPAQDIVFSKKLTQIMGQISRNPKSYDAIDNLPPGNLALRKLIAQRYCMQGIATDPEDIVITSGCMDALNLSLQAIASPGDYIVLQQNIFYGALQAAERLGLKVVTLPEHPQDGFDLTAFEHILKTYPVKICWLMLNSHNPVGFTVSDEIKQKIAVLLHQYHVHLIEDDVYEEMHYASKKPVSMKYFDQNNMVLHCSSFSKTLGAAFRVGWVHAGKYSQAIQHLQLMSTISVNTLLQNALVEFISNYHYEKHLRVLRKSLQQHKLQFYRYLESRLPTGCKLQYHPSGYFLWLKLPENVESMAVYEALIQQQIGVAPGRLFNVSEAKTQYIRLNCSFAWKDEIQQALDALLSTISALSSDQMNI